ncbi:solute carrier family 12 member 8 [Tachypleus tridentatus]|uniref:solute carrier family 12 member 8 n=1 Tax=Tachypleus tridentatus TaxID=6853 RepID=UPI003FD6B0EF
MAESFEKPSSDYQVDWERYGLRSDSVAPSQTSAETQQGEKLLHGEISNQNELFHEDQISDSKPWWKANFFLSEPVLFGTWDGVFTSCMINLFGVIVFLRTGWIVGNAGIGFSVLVIMVTVTICTMAVMAGIGICERCHVESGGVHFLLSHVLGAQIGGAFSIVYCFGQAVSCALHVMGFAESMSELLSITNPWLERSFAFGLIILLLVINIAGVKWVIRLQFLLLIILLLAALDFAVGTFITVDPVNGVTGYTLVNVRNNSRPSYSEDQNWFTLFGVFFPAMTGIFAGINMSGDLHNPSKDIPAGTLASIGTSLLLYLLFALGLGATCERWALQTDYMIAEKVSAIGVMLLSGLYVSSMSSCLGSLYASPHIIQSMANENVLPSCMFLGRGKGPNKVPVYAIILFAFVIFIFILIGQINTLAPIVTIPFLLTYAAVEYAYFSLAMTFDIQQQREERYHSQGMSSPAFDVSQGSKRLDQKTSKVITYGSTSGSKYTSDLDQLFPERLRHKQQMVRQPSSQSTNESPLTSPDEHSSVQSAESTGDTKPRSDVNVTDKSSLLDKDHQLWPEISRKTRAWYSVLCNRWIALIGALVKVVIMFLVQWGYALSVVMAVAVMWFYIGQVNPGIFPGVAQFRLLPWLKNLFLRCIGQNPPDYDQIVVTPMHPGMEVMAAQLTEENKDYAARERYHQSTTVKGNKEFRGVESD